MTAAILSPNHINTSLTLARKVGKKKGGFGMKLKISCAGQLLRAGQPTPPLEKTVVILIMPMLEISRVAISMKEKAPAGCSLLTQGL